MAFNIHQAMFERMKSRERESILKNKTEEVQLLWKEYYSMSGPYYPSNFGLLFITSICFLTSYFKKKSRLPFSVVKENLITQINTDNKRFQELSEKEEIKQLSTYFKQYKLV